MITVCTHLKFRSYKEGGIFLLQYLLPHPNTLTMHFGAGEALGSTFKEERRKTGGFQRCDFVRIENKMTVALPTPPKRFWKSGRPALVWMCLAHVAETIINPRKWVFISAVNIPAEQKTGLKRELSQQQEWLFKEKENAEFLLFRERKRKQNQGWNINALPTHKLFFFVSFVAFTQKVLFSTASDHLWWQMSELPFLHI